MKRSGLILKAPTAEHWVLGSGKASQRFGAAPLNPSADWRPFAPTPEEQRRFGFETMNCTNFATIKAWLALARFYGFAFLPNAAERYTGVHTNTTPDGNDPHDVAEIIRRHCGLVSEEVMPWGEAIDTWEEYYDRPMALKLLPLGRSLLDTFELGHEWVFPWGSTLTPAQKALKIQEALTRGPVCVSVDGSYRKKGQYYAKDVGAKDTHWVFLTAYEGTHAVLHDQYEPFEKLLAKDYDFQAAKVYFLKQREEGPRTFWSAVRDMFAKLFAPPLQTLPEAQKAPVEPVPAPRQETVPLTVPESAREPSKGEVLYAVAKGCLGVDMAPTQDVVGCAEALSFVLMKAGVKGLPKRGILGTAELDKWLAKHLQKVKEPMPGDIIMSATGSGNGKVRGHTGVVGKTHVMSNNSATFKWDAHWTLPEWLAYYEKKGGIPTRYYRWV